MCHNSWAGPLTDADMVRGREISLMEGEADDHVSEPNDLLGECSDTQATVRTPGDANLLHDPVILRNVQGVLFV